MRTDRFDYDLPPERIAQEPVPVRDQARLLVDRGPERTPEHEHVHDLPTRLRAGDVVVVNDTRVRHARLALRKPTGGAVEALLLRPVGDGRWEALIGANRPVPPGTVLTAPADDAVTVRALDDLGGGRRLIEVHGLGDDPDRRLRSLGDLPLPPYLEGSLDDDERYQTVYARRTGSAAAPTAGLHLTVELLGNAAAAGATVVSVELDVGLATFRPIGSERIEDHVMHTESYRITPAAWNQIREADRVIAVGTTTVRALESAARGGCLAAESSLFITPGFDWRVVDVLMTNFHLPRSSLLVLVEAFVGPRWRDLYAVALEHGYRFLSFGDAMLLERTR